MHSSYSTVSKKEWVLTIKELENNDVCMFILRSLANAQQVSYHSIAAFNGELVNIESEESTLSNISSANAYIGSITRVLRKICSKSDKKDW